MSRTLPVDTGSRPWSAAASLTDPRLTPGSVAAVLAGDRFEAVDELARMADERPRVEHGVEVDLRSRGGQPFPEGGAVVEGGLGVLLDDAVRLVAGAAALHEGEQGPLGV